MINSPNDQLDEFIKQTLKNHEVPFNEAHWNEFESKLNTKPHTNVLKKWRYSLNIFVGLILVGSASAFIYNQVSTPSNVNNDKVQHNTTSKSLQNTSASKTSTSVIDEYNATQKNNPIVINKISDNNTFSVFTSNNISNDVNTVETNTNKPNGYSVATNNSTAKKHHLSDGNNDRIDPREIQKQLALAKKENVKTQALFPDMMDKRKGPIYKTKESDTIKDKAEKDFSNFSLYTNGKVNVAALKQFFDNTHKKMDSDSLKTSGEKPTLTPAPSDSLKASNDN